MKQQIKGVIKSNQIYSQGINALPASHTTTTLLPS